MVLTRIGTLGQNTALRTDTLRQQSRLFDFQRQVSSGYVSHNYKGLAPDIATLNGNKSLRETKTQYSQNIEFISLRTERYRFAMDSLHDGVDRLRTQVLNAVSAYDATGTMLSVRSSYQLFAQLINTEENGQQIFGGSRTDAKPWNDNFLYPDDFKVEANAQFSAANTISTFAEIPTADQSPLYSLSMANPTNLTANDVGAIVQIDIAGQTVSAEVVSFTDNQNFQLQYAHPELSRLNIVAGTTAVNAGGKIFDRLDDIVNDNLRSNGALKELNIDDGISIEYGIEARPLLEDAMKVIGRMIQYDDAADFAASKPLQNSHRNFMVHEVAGLVDSIGSISLEQTKNGLNQNILDDTKTRHDDELVYIEEVIAGIEDVDMAAAISEMQLAELSLQASFSTLSRVTNTTLLSFL